MKVIIAGGRDFDGYEDVEAAVMDSGFEITEIVCGMARGADTLGLQWALAHTVPVSKFPADWERFGKKAGFLRNSQMAEYADALIAMPGGPGTRNMINLARQKGLKIYIWGDYYGESPEDLYEVPHEKRKVLNDKN